MDASVGVTGRNHKLRWFRACRIVIILVQAVNAGDEAAKSNCVFRHKELRKDDAWCHVDERAKGDNLDSQGAPNALSLPNQSHIGVTRFTMASSKIVRFCD